MKLNKKHEIIKIGDIFYNQKMNKVIVIDNYYFDIGFTVYCCDIGLDDYFGFPDYFFYKCVKIGKL